MTFPRRRVLRGGLALVVVVTAFVVLLPRIGELSSAARLLGEMTGLELAALIAVATFGLVAAAAVLMAVMPGLGLGQALVVNQTSTAVANTMPAGGLLGVGVSYRLFGSWGYSRADISLNVLLTGIGNVLCKVGFPAVALLLLATSGDANGSLFAAALLGLAVLLVTILGGAIALTSERGARRVGVAVERLIKWVLHWFRRSAAGDGGAVAVQLRRQAIGLLRRRGGRLTGAMLAFYVTQYALLLIAVRAVGVSSSQVSRAEALAVFSIVGLLSVLPVTPGGVGLVEVGLAGALVAAGAPDAEAVAAALAFRAMSFLLPVPLGAVAYLVWRRTARWKQPRAAPEWAVT